MRKLIPSMSGGQGGFTLIELLVVIAILGVIAAIVALNVAGFFGRGTLQAAKTELHQAQTAIIAAMADAEGNVVGWGGLNATSWTAFGEGETRPWAGEELAVVIHGPQGYRDASDYVYGPFRAAYSVDASGGIVGGNPGIDGGWGATAIMWEPDYMNWTAYSAT